MRKNLKSYSADFNMQDAERRVAGNKAVVEERRAKLVQWYEWLREERLFVEEEFGTLMTVLPDQDESGKDEGDEPEVVEEIVEEIIDEREEEIS